MAKPNLSEIVERQARVWEVRERIAREGGEAARRALAHLAEGPWISLSKQWGCGARAIAAKLAEALHWQWFDKEIVAAIAEHSHTLQSIVSRLDEHAIGTINDYLAQMTVPNDPGQVNYLREMVRVVSGLAHNGNAIILGRGANFFLKPQFGLRVRLVAPLEARVRRLVEEREVDEKTARAAIKTQDDGQRAFVRQVFRADVDDATGYDLVVNTADLGLDVAARVIEAALRRKLQA
ncbi:MAG TPA: cytidylate kinase-like family protein [Candidatus Polarisedimenticolaceae bacterium]|nr:cytidylate kinase-like family protein [Candidatus Polarisedimenticolaceae bacterium]